MGREFLMCLLSLSLSGACLLAAAEGTSRLLRGRLSPKFRRALWMLVLFRLLCPWSVSGGLLDRAADVQWGTMESSLEEPSRPWSEKSVQIIETTNTVKGKYVSVETGLILLWAVGFGAAAACRGAGYVRLNRELRRTQTSAGESQQALYARLTAGTAHPPALVVSPAAPGPMLAGLLRPRIVLPQGLTLSQEELEGVLTHELTHWRRKDLWLKWLAAFAAAVHWFNPAAWLLLERLDRDCELSCDQIVVQNWDRARRARYGELLLRLASGGLCTSAALFSQRQRLKERLISIIEEKNYGKKAAFLGVTACLALLLTSTVLGAYTGPAAVGEQLTDLSAAVGVETTPTGLTWPLEVGETVELSSLFSGRVHPITGQTSTHSGIDIPQPAGTSVLAAADGTVLEADFSAEDGNYIRLRHGSVSTKYAHLQEYTVEPGQTVSAGEQIGQVGSTGRSTGAHLHFEVMVDGVRVDPLTLLDGQVTAVISRAAEN